MRVLIPFQNSKTGEIKQVKLGFSWTLSLFASFFGIPLFIRRLNTMGWILLALAITHFFLMGTAAQLLPDFTSFGLAIWLGFKGNEMTAKNYLEQGWVMTEPDSPFSKMAMQKWGITVMPQAMPEGGTIAPPPTASVPPQHTTMATKPATIEVKTILVVVSGIAFLAFLASTGQRTSTDTIAHRNPDKEAAKPARTEPIVANPTLDSNGLPKCDSTVAKEMVKSVLADTSYAGTGKIKVYSFEEVNYASVPAKTDLITHCWADTLTNIGKQLLHYNLFKAKDGNLYVEVSVPDNGEAQ